MSLLPGTTHALPAPLTPGGRFAQWRPARPRYVVCDVDGTLLGAQPVAAPAVARAAAAALQHGIAVGFATGRLPAGVDALQAQLGLPGPHIVLNGSQVRSNGQPLRTWSLAPGHRDALVDYVTRRGLYVELYVDDGFWVNADDPRARIHWDKIIGRPKGVLAPDEIRRTDVIKATIVAFDPSELERVVADVRAMGLRPGPATSPVTPGLTYVNITEDDVDKGRALTAAAAHVGVPLDAVMAVGDHDNDLAMLAVAGTAVAMGQASAAVRERAHLVVGAVDDDGVADALRLARTWPMEPAG